jgi:Uma2 family endonuclease
VPDIHGYTVADLHVLPGGARQWELIDGSFIVSPPATTEHNTIARWLAIALSDANPADDFVIGTGQSTTIDAHNELRPDVIVAPAGCLRQPLFPLAGAQLVVEVVSPTSMLQDVEIKRALYARSGIPAYWIVAPQSDRPTISLTELVLEEPGGRYKRVTDDTTEVFETRTPWPVRVNLPRLTAARARLMRTGPA